MSEITKLYKNARVLKECLSPCYINKTWRKTHDCPNCDNRENYPPFTAEKQIAILQLLTQQCDLTISHFREWEFIHYDGQEPTQITGEDFTETFAKLINAYWQNLTPEEKQQIKEILQ